MYKSLLYITLGLSALHVCIANAKPAELDLPVRSGFYHVSYVLSDAATATETREWSRTILKASAIPWAKQASVSYSTSVQNAEILEAYTRKADGRRINVPKDNYQMDINKGRNQDGPVFSDNSSISVVFPDVAVGDTVVFSYRVTEKEAIFPGHFSTTESFPKTAPFDDVRITIDYPDALAVRYEGRGLQEQTSHPAAGYSRVEWTYANPKPLQSERQDYSVLDPEQETGYAFSTFASYADIARAYGVRALPKAAVTPEIKQLAEQIIGAQNSKREQARLLYEWVAKNITYGGNCVGIGAVVPHDISFILSNKMGDCKDHATLLQALLASQGIESDQALINAGSIYSLPRIPVLSNINHVINYLPTFDLYLDSTSDSTPFGMLPWGDRGKPVLHVAHYQDGTRTPTPRQAQAQMLESRLTVNADGSISGTVDATLKGDAAVGVREWARQLSRNDEDDFVKNAFRAAGTVASGKLIKDDPSAFSDTYHYRIIITKAEKFLKSLHGGSFTLYPLLAGNGIRGMVPAGPDEHITYDIACSNGSATETYILSLPKGMKILSIPKNAKVTSSVQSYQASYTLKNHQLTAKRLFEDSTPGSVCGPAISAEYFKLGTKVLDNLQEQVLFK
jgi:hypothetical protein